VPGNFGCSSLLSPTYKKRMVNFVDILLILLMLSSALTGWHRGFVLGAFDLLRWVGSLLIGLRFYPYVADWWRETVDWNEIWIPPFSFFLVTVLASFLIQALSAVFLRKLPLTLHSRPANRLLGLLPGLLSGAITAAIVAVLLLALPLPEALEPQVQGSRLTNRLASYTDRLETALAPVFEPAVNRTLNKLTVAPGSDDFIKLPYTVARSQPRPDLEAQMLEMINQERLAHGLTPLAADTALTRVARMHSSDMFGRGYFSHHTPEGHDPFHRIRRAKIPFRAAGENLALAPTLPIAHNGLMNSPGHRANILQKKFGRVGIGIMDGGARRLMITQNFRN
jgi:uncharacterized protein YkwD